MDNAGRAGAAPQHDVMEQSFVRGLGTPIIQFFQAMKQRHKSRQNAVALTRLSDTTLKDIGISQGAILGIAGELVAGRTVSHRPSRNQN